MRQTSAKNIPCFAKAEPAFAKTSMENKYNSRQAPSKPAKLFARNHEILVKPAPSSAKLARSFARNHEILAKPAPFSATGALAEEAIPQKHLAESSKYFQSKPREGLEFRENSRTLATKSIGFVTLCSQKTKLNCKLKLDSRPTSPKCHENSS